MIGQTTIKKTLQTLIKIPQFIIVTGASGSGKSLLIESICKTKLKCNPTYVESMDDIKQIFINAVTAVEPQAYSLHEFDTLNFRAKEAILKLCEDIPNNIYIFIETNNLITVKQTLISRAFIFELEPYSKDQLIKYCLTLENATEADTERLTNIFETPGLIKRANSLNVQEFLNFCNIVSLNLKKVPLSNAMKISNSLKLKAASTGYDLDLFFIAVRYYAYINKDTLGIDFAYTIISTCSKILYNLYISASLNKQMLFDNWLLRIRGGT